MNNHDVIAKVSKKTGITEEICQKIVKAFEEQSGDFLINKFKGVKDSHEDILAGVTEKSGCSPEDCQKVIAVLDEVLDAGLASKLKIFKKK